VMDVHVLYNVHTSIFKKLRIFNQSRDDSRSIKRYINKLECTILNHRKFLYPYYAFYGVVFVHSWDITILIVLLRFNIVHYSWTSLFQYCVYRFTVGDFKK